MFTNKLCTLLTQSNMSKSYMYVWKGKLSSLMKDVPSDGLPIVGSIFSLIASGSSPKLHLYIDSKHKKLGSIFREVMPSRSTIFLSDPDKIREVFSLEGKYPSHFLPESWLIYNRKYGRKRGLLFMEGDEWLHYRKMLNQFLIRDNIATELSHVYEIIIDSLITKWKAFDRKCLPDLEQNMYSHSISFMLATALGSSYVEQSSQFQTDLDNLTKAYQQIFNATSRLMLVPVQTISFLNLPIWKSFVSAMDESLLRSANVISKLIKISSTDGLLRKLLDGGVSEKMVNILLTDLMIAAGDTTAFTMQWSLYLLGWNKRIQKEMIEDPNLVKGVIKETLRLYPAAPFLTRVIQQPLEAFGYQIPAGELIVMSMYTCGRDHSNFPNPNEFQPNRWKRTDGGHLIGVTHKFASIPFSMGVRSCVGKKLAENLMNRTIQKIIMTYELETLKKTDMILRMTPAPTERIQMRINSRQ